jgi:2-dehydro-3-deoxyphosphooctonate aldolase (KDO 8-P synthase)
MTPRHVTVGDITLGNDLPLVFIIGPNTLESRAHALEMSAALNEMANKLGIGLVYKTSFDKANRSSLQSERGIGLRAGLPILAEVRETTGLPVLTDVHEKEQCAPVAKIVDILQIPAFLCRQTDLLLAAGATGKPINIKKGQFLAPWDIKNAAAKIASTGNDRIMLCERGSWRKPATRSSSTPRIPWPSRAVLGIAREASANSHPSSRVLRRRSASPPSSSKRIRIPTTPPPPRDRPWCL